MVQRHVYGVGHVALQLSNLEDGLAFFRDWLGFKVKFEAAFENHRLVMLRAGKIELEMWEAEGELPHGDAGFGVHHLAIAVKDLDIVMAEVKARAIPIIADVYEPTRGIREAIVRGPDGLRVQFVEENVPLLIWRAMTGDFVKAD
ncbi:MAG: VOC family protein [Anaerolineae bacterium]|nr:VOC family protein [Anaerolineae bacterium]